MKTRHMIILPGVGFHSRGIPKKMADVFDEKLPNWTYEFHGWTHGYPAITPPFKESWIRRFARNWTEEVIYDFQYAVLHAYDMTLPYADVYIGHSAGSILALAQGGDHIITLGSPAALVEKLGMVEIAKIFNFPKRQILNIVNKKDILSFPINRPMVENWYYKSHGFGIPLVGSHLDYWTRDTVLEKMVERINQWFPTT